MRLPPSLLNFTRNTVIVIQEREELKKVTMLGRLAVFQESIAVTLVTSAYIHHAHSPMFQPDNTLSTKSQPSL
jgi:hypothetical protein